MQEAICGFCDQNLFSADGETQQHLVVAVLIQVFDDAARTNYRCEANGKRRGYNQKFLTQTRTLYENARKIIDADDENRVYEKEEQIVSVLRKFFEGRRFLRRTESRFEVKSEQRPHALH